MKRTALLGATVVAAALALGGCSGNLRAAEAQTSSASVEPSSVEPSSIASESLSPVEQLGQDTEIPRDQLNIMEQKTPLSSMMGMVESGDMDGIAKLSVADRAALGYYIAKKIVPEDQQTYNVNELDNDLTSFATQENIANGIRPGGAVLAATGEQFGSLIRATSNEARALALASWYQPLDASGGIASYAKHSMENYEQVSKLDQVEAPYPGAKKETGWLEGTDNRGQKQWMKVIEQVIPDEGIDQTGQIVRVTVRTEDGKEIFWYMDGQVGEKQGGNELSKYAELAVG